jgi:TP901 family phage tail tape measure protein
LGVGDLITGGLATGGIIAGIEKLTAVIEIGINAAVEYEKALDDLSALTGKTGADLAQLESVAKSLQNIDIAGERIVSTGPEILNALKLVGGARPELLENAAALSEVTRQAIILSQASGDGLDPSVTALTTVLGQFNLQASDSKRVINELAAGAKVGASEIPQTTDALKEFGTVAKIANASTSDSIALIELLADRQLKGAEAGTQLRNVLAKLASADIAPKPAQEAFARLGIDINILKDSTLPLETRLKELGKAQGDVSALTKIFGLENLQAATIITSGLDKYDALKKGIEGTNEAYIQAAIRSDNAATSFQNLKNNALNELQQGFSVLTPALKGASDGLSFLFEKTDLVGKIFKAAIGTITLFTDALGLLGGGKQETGNASAQETIDLIFSPPKQGDQMKPFLDRRAEDLKKINDLIGNDSVNSI